MDTVCNPAVHGCLTIHEERVYSSYLLLHVGMVSYVAHDMYSILSLLLKRLLNRHCFNSAIMSKEGIGGMQPITQRHNG